MSAYLIVRSDTSQIDSKDFDYWYENEHLYEAKKQFMAKNAKRGWYKIQIFILLYMNLKILKKQKMQWIQKNYNHL